MNRERFPGLGGGWARLDGPAGTQMVDVAIDAMTSWMRSGSGANHGGAFAAAHATDEVTERARASVAALLGGDPRGVVFGPSMTALTLHLTAAAGRELAAADEIVCSRLDHDANVRPWLIAAERAGARVVFAEPEPETLELPARAVEAVLSERTRWVAVTAASNACGTIPDLPGIVAAAHAVGARVFVDAVHATPHRPLDVAGLGCDVLACSAYKWFGPHVGILCARPELLEALTPDKLRPSPDAVPERWELGTQPFESLAGVLAAADYVRSLDWAAVRAHEDALLGAVLAGLAATPGVHLHGAAPDRTSTLMFTVDGLTSAQVAARLAAREIAVWDGNYYAWELFHHLGLEPEGAVRAGFVHYNDTADAERLLEAVGGIAGERRPAGRARLPLVRARPAPVGGARAGEPAAAAAADEVDDADGDDQGEQEQRRAPAAELVRDQPCDERAREPDPHGGQEPHRIAAGEGQAGERPDHEALENQEEQVAEHG